jgi:hypothetical protein
MALAQIPTGSDNTLQLTFEDNAGVAVDLDNATEITVKIYQKKAHILGSYSLTDNTVVIINANTGRANVYINRSDLTAVVNGKLYAEVSIDITNANFEAGEKRTIVSDIILGEVVVSV